MKYILETTPSGCKETLIYEDEKLGTVILENTATIVDEDTMKLDNLNNSLPNQLRELGFLEDIPDAADETTGATTMFHFARLAQLLEGDM